MSFDDAWLVAYNAKTAAQRAGRASSLVPANDGPAAPKGKRARPRDLETPIHISIVEFLDYTLPAPLKAFHFANGEKRSKRDAGRLKAMGVKPGAADIIILGWMRTGVPTFIWFEVKSGEGRLSKSQKGWRDWCISIGAPWYLVRSIADAEYALLDLGIPLRGKTI